MIFFPTTEQAKSKMMGCGTGVATPSTPMDSPERYFDRISLKGGILVTATRKQMNSPDQALLHSDAFSHPCPTYRHNI